MQADFVRTEEELQALINEGADADKVKKGAEALEKNTKTGKTRIREHFDGRTRDRVCKKRC